jgi:crotonobetainyl-CoA:carnitine CoA-transferase CaiB-like acyl-CoA transferase
MVEDQRAPTWRGPLEGVRVLDLTRVLAGPFATQNLGDLGAEILKIEPPGKGDETRQFAPFVGGESHYFLALNRSKKSLVIDLKTPEGADLLKKLVAKSDILIENFRAGVMDKLGLGFKELSAINPRLIYCAISGFGMSGPLRDRPAFDIVTQALTGVLSVNGAAGQTPVKLGLPLGDLVGGVFGPIAVLAALHERSVTGRGRLIDISLFDGLTGMLGYLAQLALITGKDPQPVGSSHPTIVPYGSFRASDGEIIIAALSDVFWQKLCEALGLTELSERPELKSNTGRREHRDEINRAIEGVIAQHGVGHWEELFRKFDVPHAPVLGVTAALAQPQAVAREMVTSVEHATAGTIKIVGRPVKFPDAPQAPLTAPPTLGQHTTEVLQNLLALSDVEIEQLRRAGVIDRRGDSKSGE